MIHNNVVNDTTHDLIHFPNLTKQVKSTSSGTSTKRQAVLMRDNITVTAMTTKTITAFVDHLWEWNTTGTETPVEKFTETTSLIISHSISITIDKKVAVRVTKTTELPYSINKNTQIADVSVVSPDQSNFNKPVGTTFLNVTQEGYPDLTTYLTKLLNEKTRTAEQ